jgi:hypothetical protein
MRRSLSFVGGLALALVLSQFPEYAQQYTQRLGGAVDELRVITQDFDDAAAESGLTREAALGRYELVSDDFVAGRGRSMRQTFERYAALATTLEQIRGADPWTRFTLLPKYLDSDIGARTLDDFKPAVPVTLEGLTYALAGFGIGCLVLSGLMRFLMLPFRRRHRPTRGARI